MILSAAGAARLRTSKRVAFGLTLLGFLFSLGIFAELLAGAAPVLVIGPSGTSFAPGIVTPSAYDGMSPGDVALKHRDDFTIYPLVHQDPRTRTGVELAGPSSLHPLGTDERGRDVFARLVYGVRSAIGLALGAVLLGMVLGVALGSLAGYYRGFFNDRLARLIETIDTFPAIVLVALVRAVERDPTAWSLIIVVALYRWAEVARLVRAETLKVAGSDYVVAARALGNPPLSVLRRHVLPNVLGPAVVSSVFGLASVVLLEVAVSFLEMSPALAAASLGETLAQGARHPHHLGLTAAPGLLLLTAVGASYLLADAMRDALDAHSARGKLPP